jgi:hypothetical protein
LVAGVIVPVGVGVDVGVLVAGVIVPVGVGVDVGVTVAVGVTVGVEVTVGVNVKVMVPVEVGVEVGVLVGVLVGVEVGVLVGVFVGTTPTVKHCENSEVLLLVSVAVAVMTSPLETVTDSVALKAEPQFESVETVVEPRKVLPCPKPEGSQDGLEKNSIRNGPLLGTLSSVPWMLVVPTPGVTELTAGKFWPVLEPASGSQ